MDDMEDVYDTLQGAMEGEAMIHSNYSFHSLYISLIHTVAMFLVCHAPNLNLTQLNDSA